MEHSPNEIKNFKMTIFGKETILILAGIFWRSWFSSREEKQTTQRKTLGKNREPTKKNQFTYSIVIGRESKLGHRG